MSRIDPFTRTPGVAGDAFINMHYADAIIENFDSDRSSKYIYKIVGLRGSGKSVEYSRVINAFRGRDKWLVYTLSAAGDPVTTLISRLSMEHFIDSEKHATTVSSGVSAEAGMLIGKGGTDFSVSRTSEWNPLYYSPEAALSAMVQKANDSGYRILVGVDDIARTPEMVRFLSIWGAMLLEDSKKIYLVCTGLAKNIEDFASEPSLTFFKRSDPVEMKGLNLYDIAAMYQNLLGTDRETSAKMSRFTKGYAYAYQVLGSLYFHKKDSEQLEDLIPEFERVLFRDSYDLIWNSLTPAEQGLVRAILKSGTGKASAVKSLMDHPGSYDSLRSRLENKHLVNAEKRGFLSIDLPRFCEYVALWHSDE